MTGSGAPGVSGDRPFPPGDYPVVVVGSGPGGIQLSYSLRRLGIDHAVISDDPGPGGMFRRWPFFQRLLSWTKPFAPAERGTRAYERYDWNSLLAEEAEATSSVAKLQYVDPYQSNKFVFLRFNYSTGDAAGQNMVGRATFAACSWILDNYAGIAHFYLESNFATDKKSSQVNMLRTRGKPADQVRVARLLADSAATANALGMAALAARIAAI